MEKFIVTSFGDIAEFFGVSRDTVRKEWARRGMPGRRGHYDLRDIFKWWCGQRGREAIVAGADGDPGLELLKRRREADVRCKLAEADKRELDNLVKRNQVLPKQEVLQLFSGMIIAAKKVLLQLPDRLNPRFPRAIRTDLTAEVRNEVNKVLVEMADWKPNEG